MATAWKGARYLLRAVIFSFCFASFSVAADVPLSPTAFTGWYNLALRHRLTIPRQAAQNARGFDYVFVAGFLNEVFPDYFSDNIHQLKANGIAEEQISILFPPSADGFSPDQDYIGASLRTVVARAGGQIVLVAHSRGASDLLAYLVRDSKWAMEHVRAVFLIDGTFGGSGVADYLLGQGPAIGSDIPFLPRELDRLLADATREWLQPYIQAGIESLSTARNRARWRKLLIDYPQGEARLSDRVYYICSQETPSLKAPLFYATESYLQTYYGPNDGMVTYDGQYLPQLGTRLMDVSGNHHDLVHSFPWSLRPAQARYALAAAIEMAMGGAEGN